MRSGHYGHRTLRIEVFWGTGKNKRRSQRKLCHVARTQNLVAPYCAIPRDYLIDTPLLRAMGFLVSQRVQLGAIPPPPFSEAIPIL